jgi:DHA1 family multidrug resistance protein-like MFS transporter
LTLEVFPIVFNEDRHWSLVISALPFLSILVGVICAVVLNFANQPRYQRAVTANDGKAVPEARLPPIIVGGVLLSVGLFWFGWTAPPKYPWSSPVVAGGKNPHHYFTSFTMANTIHRLYSCRLQHRFSTMS